MMKLKLRLAPALMAAIFALAGCSVLPKPGEETRYTLSPVNTWAGGNDAVQIAPEHTIRVARPDVPLAYRGSQLVLEKNGQQTAYAGKSWNAPVPDLLAAALTRDLSASLKGWMVVAETGGVRSSYELQTEVRTFATVEQATEEGSTSTVIMDMDIRLVDTTTREVVMLLPYSYREKLEELTTEQTLAAYNKGWQQLVARIAAMLPNG